MVTQLVEVPLYMGLLQSRPLRRRFVISFSASALTHPVVWFSAPVLGRASGLTYWEMVGLAELYAVSIEGALFFIMGERRAWWVALGVNLCSVVVGLALRRAGVGI